MPKKLISAMLMLALLCSSLAIPTDFHLTASADDTTYWNNNASTEEPSKEDPTGAGANVYLIDSAEELAWVAVQVNGGNNFSGKTIKLTDDIDLAKDASGKVVSHQWVPIGLDNNNPFKGNFDGQGHEIKNMHIGTSGAYATYEYAGLFGYVKADNKEKPVTIQNVNIGTGSWVYASGQLAGGICVYASAADGGTITISNCCNSANIKGPSAGGIFVFAEAIAATITIINCCNSGTVTAFYDASHAGGIFVFAEADDGGTITISNCCNSANIKGSSAGGICARAYTGAGDTITISNCSNSGNIEAAKHAGGICADAKATISNCSNSGTVTAFYDASHAGGICAFAYATINNCSNSGNIEATKYAGGICAEAEANATISNCYYLDGCVGTTDENGIFEPSNPQRGIGNKSDQTGTTALPENQMTAETGKTTGTSFTGSDNKEYYALVDALNAWVKAYNNNNKPAVEALYWEVKEAGKYPTFLNTWSAKVTLDSEFYCYADFSPFAADNGKGTSAAAPYEIKNAAQLAALAILVNNAGTSSVKDINNNSATCSDFQNTFIKLTASFSLGAHEWVPIGHSGTNPFKGNFDGDNKIISNMHIGTSGTYANYNYAGLFGYVQANNNVTIQNVNIGENSWVYSKNDSGDAYAGGICAFANAFANADAKITISNCSNSGQVSSDSSSDSSYAGGICAYASSDDASTITISNCSNSGQISSSSSAYAGGICAYADAFANADAKITISNCSNSGQVSSDTYAGGICAYASSDDASTITISNCSNSGQISSSYAGGICAKAYAIADSKTDNDSATITISNCSNSGQVSSDSSSSSAYAGGICAYASSDDASTITISNCSNSGQISSSYAGGICAKAYAFADNNKDNSTATITISNCSNSGQVSSSFSSYSSYSSYAGGICAYADAANADATITISNCYYLYGCVGRLVNDSFTANKRQRGLGNQICQHLTPALPRDQMKAATESSAPSGDNTWKSITVTGTGIIDKAVPLVDALNAWVNNYNTTKKGTQGYIEALPWAINETSGYPEINYTVPNLSFQTELGHDICALPIKSVGTNDITVPTLNILSNPQGNKIKNVYWFLDGNYYSASGTGTDSGIEELKEAIRVKIAKDKLSPITVKAVYQDEDYNIVKGSVDDGNYILEVVEYNKLSVGAYEYDTDVIVSADTTIKNNENKDFLYWEGNADNDPKLEILSYASSYTFRLKTDRTIIAVYGDRAENAPVATTNIESISEILLDGATALRVASTGSVAGDYKIDYAGLIITNDGNLAENPEDFKINKNLEVSYSSSDEKKCNVYKSEYESPGQNIFYSLRLIVSNMEEPLYVRAFIRYKNDTDLQNVEHSEIFKIEFAGDTMTWTSLSREGGSN